MVSTRKANANTHPGRVVTDSQQHRRSKQQVQDDNARAKAAAHAKEQEATIKRRATIKRIAELEDDVALIEKDMEIHAQRPDLHYGRHVPLEPMEEDNDGSASTGDQPDLGVDATFGTENLAEDNDRDPGPAYEDDIEGNNDSGPLDDEDPDILAHRFTKRKENMRAKAIARGHFRAEVTSAHKLASGTAKKRKTHPSGTTHIVPKRIKAATAGGLSSDWRARTSHLCREKTRILSGITSTVVDTEDDNSENRRPRGEFDEGDTDIDNTFAMTPVKAKTRTAPRPNSTSVSRSSSATQVLGLGEPARRTDQMNVAVNVQSVAKMSTGCREPKQKTARKKRPTLLDLPLPRDGRYLQTWRKKFVPLLISWAGSQPDPFGTNGRIDRIVASTWRRVYSDIEINDLEMDIVVIVAENTLNNWRSDMGKAGYRVVSDIFGANTSRFGSAEDRAEYVAENLKNFNFLYKYPQETSKRGAFCSHLVSRVFSFHMRKISMGPVSHNPQVGGLALAAAAVERSLTFFKTGEDVLKLERDPETGQLMPRAIRGLGFTENLWGNKAREFVKTTMRLTDKHWEDITENTASFMSTVILDSDDESNGNNNGDAEMVSPNPRSIIDLD